VAAVESLAGLVEPNSTRGRSDAPCTSSAQCPAATCHPTSSWRSATGHDCADLQTRILLPGRQFRLEVGTITMYAHSGRSLIRSVVTACSRRSGPSADMLAHGDVRALVGEALEVEGSWGGSTFSAGRAAAVPRGERSRFGSGRELPVCGARCGCRQDGRVDLGRSADIERGDVEEQMAGRAAE